MQTFRYLYFFITSFKTITSGEGGVVTTNNSKIAKKLNFTEIMGFLRDKNKHWKYNVLKHGYNYRLSDINCALGLSQLKKINFFRLEEKDI